MTEPADLLKWIRRQRLDIHAGEDEEGRTIVRLDLIHTIDGEGFEKLETFMVSDDSESEDLASKLYDAALHDSETRMGGAPQRYSVLGYRKLEAREHECQYAFILRQASTQNMMGSGTEPPTDKGVTAHYMRHDENMHRLMLQGSEALMGRLAGELQRETTRRVQAEEQVIRVREHEQELLDRKMERELRFGREVHNAKFLADLSGLVTSLAPLIISKLIAGKDPVGSAAPEGRDLSIQKFLKTLDKPKIMGIMNLLDPAQQVTLFELYQSYAQDEEKEQQKRPEVLRDGQEEKAREEAQ